MSYVIRCRIRNLEQVRYGSVSSLFTPTHDFCIVLFELGHVHSITYLYTI